MEQAEKNVHDEFMLREYETIAAAHFDSQSGLRQHFRFYLIIAAFPLTVLGFASSHAPANANAQLIALFNLPPFVSTVFIGTGILGTLMSLAMIHSAFDCVLYARTVNGVRAYFADRAKWLNVDLKPYFVMPLSKVKPRYFHFGSFFYRQILISLVNAAYVALGVQNFWKRVCWTISLFALLALGGVLIYPLFCLMRERKQLAD